MYLQQVEQMLVSLQLLPFVFVQRLETFVFVQGHHVRQLLFVLLGEFLMVGHHLLHPTSRPNNTCTHGVVFREQTSWHQE